jgi:hypothetical protein
MEMNAELLLYLARMQVQERVVAAERRRLRTTAPEPKTPAGPPAR